MDTGAVRTRWHRELSSLAAVFLLACDADTRDAERTPQQDPAPQTDASPRAESGHDAQGGLRDGAGDALDGGGDHAAEAGDAHGGGDSPRDSGSDAEVQEGVDGAPGGREDAALPSLAGVDLSLGGINQDLAPSGDCLSSFETYTVCVDMVGEFDGQRFTNCKASSETAGTAFDSHVFGCNVELPAGQLLELSVGLGSDLIGNLPSTFSFSAPPQQSQSTYVSVYVSQDGGLPFSSHEARQAGDVNAELRVSAVAGLGPGVLRDTLSQFERGSLALAVSPTSNCNPEGGHCHRVRIRANFTARTVYRAYELAPSMLATPATQRDAPTRSHRVEP